MKIELDRDEIVRRQGDPDCLHCELVILIDKWAGARGEKVDPIDVVNALGEVIGQMIAPVRDEGARLALVMGVGAALNKKIMACRADPGFLAANTTPAMGKRH